MPASRTPDPLREGRSLDGPIADEQSAIAHVLKTAEKALTVVEGLILAYVAGVTWHNYDGTVPYIWVSWLTRLLLGEVSSEWTARFRAQHEDWSWSAVYSDLDRYQ